MPQADGAELSFWYPLSDTQFPTFTSEQTSFRKTIMCIVLTASLIMSAICHKRLLNIAVRGYCTVPIRLDWIEP